LPNVRMSVRDQTNDLAIGARGNKIQFSFLGSNEAIYRNPQPATLERRRDCAERAARNPRINPQATRLVSIFVKKKKAEKPGAQQQPRIA